MQVKRIITSFKKYKWPINIFLLYGKFIEYSSILYNTNKTKIVFKLLKCQYGMNMKIDGEFIIKILRKKSINIGDNFLLLSRYTSNLVGLSNPSSFECLHDGEIIIGDNCGGSSLILSSKSRIRIGNNVKFGGNVRIYDHDYHSLEAKKRRNPETDDGNSSPIDIGDDVFIGVNSIILKGVNIGKRTIIGAGSVVTLKQIPDDSIVAGNPAKILRKQ